MPTPDEIRSHGNGGEAALASVAASAANRQTRPQLGCPDETPLTVVSQWRQLPGSSQVRSLLGPSTRTAIADAKQIENPIALERATAQTPPSPASSVDQKLFPKRLNRAASANASSFLGVHSPLSLSHEFSSVRLFPSLSCSYLRPGARFAGKQTSDKQEYEVNVEFKHVDMSESFLCGYLRIQGLTEFHPTLTTYFEAEMIGPKYSFLTRHSEWGATEETDQQHWAIFPPYKSIAKKACKPDYVHKNFAERDYIFMRWKEYFLVPDHNVRSIHGASFEGFYYVCFHQRTGNVSGIYFHTRSEKFQKLNLSLVNDRTFGSFEFR